MLKEVQAESNLSWSEMRGKMVKIREDVWKKTHANGGIPVSPAPPEFHGLQGLHPGLHRSLGAPKLLLGKVSLEGSREYPLWCCPDFMETRQTFPRTFILWEGTVDQECLAPGRSVDKGQSGWPSRWPSVVFWTKEIEITASGNALQRQGNPGGWYSVEGILLGVEMLVPFLLNGDVKLFCLTSILWAFTAVPASIQTWALSSRNLDSSERNNCPSVTTYL